MKLFRRAIRKRLEKIDIDLNWADGYPKLQTELEKIAEEKEQNNEKCSQNFYLLLDYVKYRAMLLENFNIYESLCILIMKLYKKAAKELELFSNISERVSSIGPVGRAYEIKFNKNDKNNKLKYYFNDNVNWIVFTTEFEYKEEKLCEICYKKLVQKFKGTDIIVKKLGNSIDVFSKENQQEGQLHYVNILKRLEWNESGENKRLIINEFKKIIKNDYNEYLKTTYQIISEVLKSEKMKGKKNGKTNC